ncbi:hypothetical protein [Chitinimonas sp.]|uniref:hypothetical protein n=1 Tax=Chitinimonas sp. TaxID=1934313 RepID=UPI0035B375B9
MKGELHSHLGKHQLPAPATSEELQAMRCRAWHEQGIAIIPLDAVADDWDRLHINSIASRLYGPRTDKPKATSRKARK